MLPQYALTLLTQGRVDPMLPGLRPLTSSYRIHYAVLHSSKANAIYNNMEKALASQAIPSYPAVGQESA